MAEEDAFEAFEGRLGNATSEPSETRRPTRGFLKSAKDVAIPAHKRTKNFVELTGADPLELDAETPAGMKIADDDTVAASSGTDPSETWSAVGQPPDLGVLIHCFDEREEAAQPWMPKTPPNGEPYTADYLKMSGSLIYSAQQQSSTQIPLFNDGSSGGVVLRPSATRVFCGFGADAGGLGHCAPQSTDCYPGCWQAGKTWSVWCEPEEVHLHGNQEGTCYNRPYRPADMGVLFERAALNGHYNEVIVDSLHWAAHLPDAIEAFWYHAGTDDLVVQQLQQWHTRFLAAYPGASAATYPLLILDRTDWQTPFSGG